ncbi:hypothetical protein ABFS82_11G045500 [Erythranthe guttata]
MNSMVMIIVGFMLMAITHCASAHGGAAPAPAPSPAPSNDGAAVDQGIAYLLMLLALAITYLIH